MRYKKVRIPKRASIRECRKFCLIAESEGLRVGKDDVCKECFVCSKEVREYEEETAGIKFIRY